jgi:hypothetical protein
LPDLKNFGFTFRSRRLGDCRLGQCRRCGTVFWEETGPVPGGMEEGVVELTDPWEA